MRHLSVLAQDKLDIPPDYCTTYFNVVVISLSQPSAPGPPIREGRGEEGRDGEERVGAAEPDMVGSVNIQC